MSYPPPSSGPEHGGPPPPQQPYYQPPQAPQPVKSGANKVLLIVLGIFAVICLGCGAIGAYSLWWAQDKANEIIDNIPTDFPTNFPTAPAN